MWLSEAQTKTKGRIVPAFFIPMLSENSIAALAMILVGLFVVADMAHKKITNKDAFDFGPCHAFNALGCLSFICGWTWFFPFVLEAIASAVAVAFFSFGCYSVFKAYKHYKDKKQGKDKGDDGLDKS